MPEVLLGSNVTSRYGEVPSRVTPVVVQDDRRQVIDDLATDEVLRIVEVRPHEQARVEQPVLPTGNNADPPAPGCFAGRRTLRRPVRLRRRHRGPIGRRPLRDLGDAQSGGRSQRQAVRQFEELCRMAFLKSLNG
jgi:hypothetical protein